MKGMEDPAEGSSVAGDASAWCCHRRVRPSVCARRNATPRLCPCAPPTAGSMRTTVKCTAPPVFRRKEYMSFTARTVSSKVRLSLTLMLRLFLLFFITKMDCK